MAREKVKMPQPNGWQMIYPPHPPVHNALVVYPPFISNDPNDPTREFWLTRRDELILEGATAIPLYDLSNVASVHGNNTLGDRMVSQYNYDRLFTLYQARGEEIEALERQLVRFTEDHS